MKTQSAKAKGRRLQQKVVSKILEKYPELHPDDVTSRSMGAGGEDILLSPAARQVFPFSVECKSHATFAVYKHYDQAKTNSGKATPILVIMANRRKPLVVLELDDFMDLL